MTEQTFTTGASSTSVRLAALCLAAAGGLALAGCGQHPYPSPGPTAAPAQGEAQLAGAPTTRTPQYVPPPPPAPYGAQPGYGGQPPYGPQPYPQGAPPPPPPAYGQGYARPPSGAPEVVTMAPIPNPPEEPRNYWRHEHRAWRHHARSTAYAPPPYAMHRHLHHGWRAAPVYAPPSWRHNHRPAAPYPAAPARPAVHHAPPAPYSTSAAPAPTGAQLAKPAAPEHHRHHHGVATGMAAGTAATAAAASGGSTRTTGEADTTSNTTTNTVATGSEADRYQALGATLKDSFGSAAELKAPAHMEANQPATVTLTLPANFAQTVRTEAAKENLADQAMTVNLVGSLTGDGYTIVPDQPQTMPLTLDTPTVFTWKVTPTGGGRGALKAAMRAQMVGDGHDLDLGSKSTGSGAATGRVVGIGLLALIALVLLGWAAQRRRPAPVGATKPRVANFDNQPPRT